MKKLYAPEDYWKSCDYFVSNGCGAGWSAKLVPDCIIGVNISAACKIHDWMYLYGNTIDDKKEADRVFLNNMIRIITNKSCFKPLMLIRLFICKQYYNAVKYFGGPFFWGNKNGWNVLGDIK